MDQLVRKATPRVTESDSQYLLDRIATPDHVVKSFQLVSNPLVLASLTQDASPLFLADIQTYTRNQGLASTSADYAPLVAMASDLALERMSSTSALAQLSQFARTRTGSGIVAKSPLSEDDARILVCDPDDDPRLQAVANALDGGSKASPRMVQQFLLNASSDDVQERIEVTRLLTAPGFAPMSAILSVPGDLRPENVISALVEVVRISA